MSNTKGLSERFLVALFRRGEADFLPLSYLKEEGGKVLKAGETDKIKAMIDSFISKGFVAEKNGEYCLIKDPFS